MIELNKSGDHLGIIGFFGVFSPGVLLLLGMLMFLDGITFRSNIDHNLIGNIFWGTPNLLTGVMLFFIAYLFGMTLRTISIDKVQTCASWWTSKLLKMFGWIPPYYPDVFPYPRHTKWLEGHDTAGIIEKVRGDFLHFDRPLMQGGTPLDNDLYEKARNEGAISLTKELGYKPRDNTTIVNFIKLLIATRSPILYHELQRDEGMVRFLAGSTISCGFTGIMALILTAMAPLGFGRDWLLYLVVGLIMAYTTHTLLTRFELSRRREVGRIWMAYHLATSLRSPETTECVN